MFSKSSAIGDRIVIGRLDSLELRDPFPFQRGMIVPIFRNVGMMHEMRMADKRIDNGKVRRWEQGFKIFMGMIPGTIQESDLTSLMAVDTSNSETAANET